MLEDMEPSVVRTRLIMAVLASPLALSLFAPARKPGGRVSRHQTGESTAPPAELAASIASNFPSYRAPTPSDITGAWATEKAAGFSFLCRGDFNGDGREDAAVILIGEHNWRLVVFEQTQAGGYRPVFVGRPKSREELGKYWEQEILPSPQQALLRTVSKGETWAPEAGDDPHLGRLKVDAIEIVTKPKPNDAFASLLIWKGGKFQQIAGDPVVEVPVIAK